MIEPSGHTNARREGRTTLADCSWSSILWQVLEEAHEIAEQLAAARDQMMRFNMAQEEVPRSVNERRESGLL